jgi:D-galacturonate reductase
MYVTGRNDTGPGTVLSSLCEFSKRYPLEKVTLGAKNKGNLQSVASKVEQLNHWLGSDLKVEYVTLGDDIPGAISILSSQGPYDCAVVAVPDHLHYAFTHALLQNRLHCLVVKPLTPTVSEALDLIHVQETLGLYGAVEFHKRFDESNLYAKRVIQDGLLGDLLYFTVDYSQRISIPLSVFKMWAHRSNSFQYLAVHYVDLIYFLTGFRPTRAMAVGTEGILKKHGLDTFDSVHATVLWQNPARPQHVLVSQFATNWIDPETTTALSDQKYKIVGTSGRIEMDQKNRGVDLVIQDQGSKAVNPYFSEFLLEPSGGFRFDGYGYRSIERFLVDILECQKNPARIATLTHCRPSFRQALVSTAVNEAVNESLKGRGEWRDIHALF